MEETRIDDGFESTKKVIGNMLEEYKLMSGRISEHRGIVTGLSTGFYDLDYKTRGLQKGELILLAGRKWMGKLGLALSIVHHVVTKEKVTTAVFSPSITSSQVIKRLLAIAMTEKEEIIFNAPRDYEEFELIKNSAQKLAEAPIYIDDSVCITVEDIRKKCIGLSSEGKLGLIVVDYLQLLSCDGEESSWGMRKVVQGLKEIAREADCPLLLISELSSDGERIWFKHPELLSIDDTDYTKQYADLIMLLYAEQYDREKSSENREAEVIIVKNRDGSTGKVRLAMELGGYRFRNLMR
jgi:replicative DNA helicase